MKSALIISHGSRTPKTKEEVQQLIFQVKKMSDVKLIECAFLELESPSIPEGIDLCVAQGATGIIVLLNFLNSGRHVDEDIPRIIEESRRKHPKIKISISPPVGQHPNIAQLFLDMLKG